MLLLVQGRKEDLESIQAYIDQEHDGNQMLLAGVKTDGEHTYQLEGPSGQDMNGVMNDIENALKNKIDEMKKKVEIVQLIEQLIRPEEGRDTSTEMCAEVSHAIEDREIGLVEPQDVYTVFDLGHLVCNYEA